MPQKILGRVMRELQSAITSAIVENGTGVFMLPPDLVTTDPQVCGGQPVLRGTRVTLRTVLASLAEGDGVDEILRSFPTLTREQVAQVIAFAAASAQDDLPIPGVPV